MQNTGAATPPAQPIYVIGLGLPLSSTAQPTQETARPDNGTLPPHAAALVHRADVLIGGKARLADFAGHPAQKIPVTADIETLYAAIAHNRERGLLQVALCSGDPLFFGLGARLSERFGPEAVRIIPGTSALQAAAACLGLPWERLRPVSLHGRASLLPLFHALSFAQSAGTPLCLLTDASLSPHTLARVLAERGFNAWRMHILDNLHRTGDGEVRAERRTFFDAASAASTNVPPAEKGLLRTIVLELDAAPGTTAAPEAGIFGIADSAFAKENNLITKAPVRAAGLAALGIAPHHVIWDLGAGSGAVAVEASRLARQGMIIAVESNPARVALIKENRQRFKAANLAVVAGTLPGCLESGAHLPQGPETEARFFGQGGDPLPDNAFPLPTPDRIFIGGGLGGSEDDSEHLLRLAYAALVPGGKLLAHCVLLGSMERARRVLGVLGASVEITLIQAGNSSPLAGDLRLEALNPVFLVSAGKPPQ